MLLVTIMELLRHVRRVVDYAPGLHTAIQTVLISFRTMIAMTAQMEDFVQRRDMRSVMVQDVRHNLVNYLDYIEGEYTL